MERNRRRREEGEKEKEKKTDLHFNVEDACSVLLSDILDGLDAGTVVV